MSETSSFGYPDDWLDFLQGFKNKLFVDQGLSENTIDAYSRDVRHFFKFLKDTGLQLENIDVYLLSDYLENCHGHYTPRTISRRLSSLNSFFTFLKKEDFLKSNPVQKLDRPSGGKQFPDYLSEEEAVELLEATDTETEEGSRDRALLEMLYSAGLRVSELTGLKNSNIDWERGEMRVEGKGSKQRQVPIGKPALKQMEEYISRFRKKYDPANGCPYFFVNKRGKQLSRQKVWQIVKKQAARAGINDVSPHTLRHSFATHMLAGGADLRSLQEILGHSDVGTTADIYVHLRDEVRQAHSDFHPRGR